MEWFWSIGWLLLIGGGFRAALLWAARRKRAQDGEPEQSVARAKRGALVYSGIALVGAALLAVHYTA